MLFAIVGVFILVDALLLGLWFGINPFHVTKSIAEVQCMNEVDRQTGRQLNIVKILQVLSKQQHS